MKRRRQLIIRGNQQLPDSIHACGKRFSLLLLCGMLICSAGTGCGAAHGKTVDSEETVKEEAVKEETVKEETEKKETQDMGSAGSGISGTIVVGSREEQEAADQTVQKLFEALEAGDAAAIRELFSPYAQANAKDLDSKIREMIEYYPGADGGYTGTSGSSESKRGDKFLHILDIELMVTDKGKEYELVICLQMRNDFDPSMEGVHLIEIIKVEDEPADFKWKNEDDAPGVYVAE